MSKDKSYSQNNDLYIDYSNIDQQKYCLSPRDLFINKQTQQNQTNQLNQIETISFNEKIINKIENFVQSYCDLVNEYYFSGIDQSNNINDNNNISVSNDENQFKLSSLDFLINPLRSPFPFEQWSPYEIALFQSCLCKFGKDFELIERIMKTKNKMEIQEFYLQYEMTKCHDAWVNNYKKKNK